MLTLKELKKIVKVADMEKRIPSVKSLKEHKVVVKEMINADTTISVYDHGYVLYTAGNQSTVFPLHSCDDYEYVSVTGDNKELNKEFFDNENWYIRLLMEAEDRMAYSQSKISTNHGVFSNSDVTDDAEIMRGSSKDFVDDVIDREILHALIKELIRYQATPKEILQNQELLSFVLPEVRRDYKLNESFIYRGECINSPLILHSGVNDIEANKEIMQRWSSVTKKVVRMREFQSDHFFVLNLGNEYWEQLYRDLLEE